MYNLDDSVSTDEADEKSDQPNNWQTIAYPMEQQYSTKPLDDDRKSTEPPAPVKKEIKKGLIHECSSTCLVEDENELERIKHLGPLNIPMKFYWQRAVNVYLNVQPPRVPKKVVYSSPCGKKMSSMEEIHAYLLATKSKLTVDLFTFETEIDTEGEFKPLDAIRTWKDIFNGKENMPIEAVNSIDESHYDKFYYTNTLKAHKSVDLKYDKEFLCGCECLDDCQDPSKCQCQLMTKDNDPNINSVNDYPGYKFRRLTSNLQIGLYECNVRCHCQKSCLNRVVQNPLKNRFQIFKTVKNDWGVRALDDIVSGMFLCSYVGLLITEKVAKIEDAKYISQLNLIEIMERNKFGFESEAMGIGDELDSGEEFVVRKKKSSKDSCPTQEDLFWREAFPPISPDDRDDDAPFSIRRYAKEKHAYLVNGNKFGNIGRFFNHSCNPNTFMQHVMVDTHDLRFPRLAFFAIRNIKAGEELTLDYHVDHRVAGWKAITCHCESSRCVCKLS